MIAPPHPLSDGESLRASLPTLVAHAVPKNARRIHCSYFDNQPLRNANGLRIDPYPLKGGSSHSPKKPSS